ncbi:MAG: hypothetical protein MJZ59_01260 [Paludibacteraceae bacterium]|nr:hypothetical protein [Paludibacteraceae bacterium]
MKKVFLALMAVAAITLVGCKDSKDDPTPTFDKIELAKAAINTDGADIDKALKGNGYAQTTDEDGDLHYKKGDEEIQVLFSNKLVGGVWISLLTTDFNAALTNLLDNEPICEKSFPSSFSADIEEIGEGTYFSQGEETQFINYCKGLKADKLIRCWGQSLDDSTKDIIYRQNVLQKEKDGAGPRWQSLVSIYASNN